MNDLDFIRKFPKEFDVAIEKRGLEGCASKILEMDLQRKKALTDIQKLQREAKELSKKIGYLKQKGENSLGIEKVAKEIFEKIEGLQKEFDVDSLKMFMDGLPNIPDESVPFGTGEHDNVEVFRFGNPREFDFIPKAHHYLGENLGIIDFEQTVTMSGSRFSSVKGRLSKLARVLVNFMLDSHVENYGYQEISPPFLVRDSAMYNVGQLPKFSDESFLTTNNLRLIPTAEVPLTNLIAGKLIPLASLPLRFAAYTECFRMEAGSGGKDLRGLIRQHQFGKVELVSITTEERSDDELECIVGIAEEILQKLDIPYRRVFLCTGDLGFASAKTYDIEVWIPSQNTYREISSCSNCKSFQARRLGTKYYAGKDKKFVHTLNGSALAIGRTLIAIMENYQNSDGTITVPELLRKSCGFDVISKAYTSK